jgi:DMSO/TMAO reductase YedYZ molybdopterin-dependent catalytic subunit
MLKRLLPLFALLALLAAVLAACADAQPVAAPSPTAPTSTTAAVPTPLGAPRPVANKGAVSLASQEVREYQGEKLSSIEEFQENSIKGPQQVAVADYRLVIDGLVERPASLTYAQALERQHYEKVVTLKCVEGWRVDILWEGVLLADLLRQAGVNDQAKVVIFHAADGYTSSLPVSYVIDNNLILAATINGVTLPAERGFPFQVVAESKWGYKWVKWVTRIELSSQTDYRGYWESSGYNNDGARAGPIFESGLR